MGITYLTQKVWLDDHKFHRIFIVDFHILRLNVLDKQIKSNVSVNKLKCDLHIPKTFLLLYSPS